MVATGLEDKLQGWAAPDRVPGAEMGSSRLADSPAQLVVGPQMVCDMRVGVVWLEDKPVQQVVGPQMAPDMGIGAVRWMMLLKMMKKMSKVLVRLDMWGASLAMVPVQWVAMVG